MANNTQVGVVLGADAGPIQRELNRVARDFAKIERATGEQGKAAQDAFDAKPLRKFARGLRAVRREAVKTHRELAKIAQTVERMTGERISVGGGGGSGGSSNGGGRSKGFGGGLAGGWQAGRGGFLSGVQHLWDLRNQDTTRAGKAGSIMGVMGGYAGRLGAWLKAKADAGQQTLMANQLARMQSRQLAGLQLSGRYEQLSRRLGYSTAQGHQLYQATARATGRSSQLGAAHTMAMARAYSMDPGTIMGYQQTLRHAGGIGPGVGPSSINDALVKGIKVGGFARALSGEYARAVIPLLQQRGQGTERVSSLRTAGLLSVMSRRLGGGFANSPMRTAQMLGGLHQAIAGNSGNEATQAFKLRAMGYGTNPNVRYYGAMKQLGRGATSKNVQALLRQALKESGGNVEHAAMTLQSVTGLPLWQTERLARMQKQAPSALDPAAIKREMARQPTDVIGQAKKATRAIPIQRRELQKAEEFAVLRSKLDKVYEAQHQLELKVVQTGGTIANKLIMMIDRLIKTLMRWGG